MSGLGCNASKVAAPPAPSVEQVAALAQAHPEAHVDLGRRVYLRQCSNCHQANGAGAAKAIPPLRGHLPQLAAQAPGRAYLAGLVLYGINGAIEVGGQKYFNVMPALQHLFTDAELAAGVNYALLAFDDVGAVRPDMWLTEQDVAAARRVPRSAAQMLRLRGQVWPEGVPAPLPRDPPG